MRICSQPSSRINDDHNADSNSFPLSAVTVDETPDPSMDKCLCNYFSCNVWDGLCFWHLVKWSIQARMWLLLWETSSGPTISKICTWANRTSGVGNVLSGVTLWWWTFDFCYLSKAWTSPLTIFANVWPYQSLTSVHPLCWGVPRHCKQSNTFLRNLCGTYGRGTPVVILCRKVESVQGIGTGFNLSDEQLRKLRINLLFSRNVLKVCCTAEDCVE